MAVVHRGGPPGHDAVERDADSCSASSCLDGDDQVSLSAPPSSSESAGDDRDAAAACPAPKVVSGVQFRRENNRVLGDPLHGLAAGGKGGRASKTAGTTAHSSLPASAALYGDDRPPPAAATRPPPHAHRHHNGTAGSKAHQDDHMLKRAKNLASVYKSAQNRTVAFKPRQPPQQQPAQQGVPGPGGGVYPSRRVSGDITRSLARNKLQKRNLPGHVMNEGMAERYYMELRQVLEDKSRVEEECRATEAKIATAEAKHRKQVARTEALLQAQASLSKDERHAARRVQLIQEQDYLKTLKESTAAVAEQIREKKAVLADVKEVSLATNIKEMERQVRNYYSDMLALQKKLEEVDDKDDDQESKHALSDVLRELQTKESVAEQAEAKLQGLIQKQEGLSVQVKELSAALKAEKEETEDVQRSLGDERKRLVRDSSTYPPHIETLQAEALTAKNQKISTDAEVQRTRHQYEVSMAQLSASMSDMQGRIDRWMLKKELQTKKIAEANADLNATTRQLQDLQQRQRLQRDAFAGAVSGPGGSQARAAALEKAIAAERSRLVADISAQQTRLAALNDACIAQSTSHKAEEEALAARLEARQKAVLEKIPFLGGGGTAADERRVLDDRRPGQRSEKAQKDLSAQRVRDGPDDAHLWSPLSDTKSEVSHRAESAVTRVRIQEERDYDQDDVAESLCRGAGGTVLDGMLDDNLYDDEQDG